MSSDYCLHDYTLQFNFTVCALRWMDGSPVGIQRWDENQPDPTKFDENCVIMTYYVGE